MLSIFGRAEGGRLTFQSDRQEVPTPPDGKIFRLLGERDPREPHPSGLEGLRVLIVEDEILSALALAEMLKELGADVAGVCTSIASAHAEIATQAFDAVTLDVNMGGSFSPCVARKLRARSIPAIYCTAYGHVIDRQSEIQVVEKPVALERLREALLAAVGM